MPAFAIFCLLMVFYSCRTATWKPCLYGPSLMDGQVKQVMHVQDVEESQTSANSEGPGAKSRSSSLKGAGRSSSLKGQGSGSKIERKVSFMDGAVPGTEDSRTMGGAPAAEEGSSTEAADAAEVPKVCVPQLRTC